MDWMRVRVEHRFERGQILFCIHQRMIRTLGLHWFRRGFGRVAGHVEVLSPRKTAEKN
jgi:hypothetical protein